MNQMQAQGQAAIGSTGNLQDLGYNPFVQFSREDLSGSDTAQFAFDKNPASTNSKT